MPAATEVQPNVTLGTSMNPQNVDFSTQAAITNPIIPNQPVAIQSSDVPLAPNSESFDLYPNSNYVEKSPCINPNFSKIIELPITPSPPPISEEPSDFNDESTPSPSKTSESPAHIENTVPKIPISHLIATNQYPSLNRVPPANIVQSFAPVYNQPKQQPCMSGAENEDLYSSYVNNPYNLTLQADQNFGNASAPSTYLNPPTVDSEGVLQTSNTNNLNVFQSVNYFGNASDTSIPPGSEMLFGNP